MPEATQANTIIEEYLRDLNSELRSAPDDVREQFVDAIKEHISEGRSSLASDDDDEIRMMLQRIGDPSVLAAELFQGSDSPVATDKRHVALRASIAILVVAILIAGLTLRATYQPQIGSGISFVRVLDSNGKVVKATRNGLNVGSSAPQIWLEPRGTYTVEVIADLQNSGDYGVTLDSVRTPILSAQTLPYSVFFSGGGNNDWNSFGKFHPVSVSGHGGVYIGIRFTEKCIPGSNRYIGVQSLPITFSFLGVHHASLVNIQPFRLTLRQSC